MTPRTALPTLFGRYSLVMSEHSNIDVALDKLREMAREFAANGASGSQATSLSTLVADLRRSLERHFRAEESSQYFGALVEERPALAPRVAALQHQHRAMLATIDGLYLLAVEARTWQQFESTLTILTKTFHTHERAESLLVQGFLAGDGERETP